MKRFLFAVAAVALVASVGSAQQSPVVIPPTTATPVVVGTPGTPVIEYGPTTTASPRRGLFGRLRTRGTPATTVGNGGTIPLNTTPGTVISPMPVVPVPMPMPMPGTTTKPVGAMTMPATRATMRSGIMVVGGTTMDGGVVTTAGYSEPAARRGLFGRRSR